MAPLCIDSCYPPAWSIMRDFYIDFIFILDIYVYLKNIVNTVNLDISHTQTILPRPDGFGYPTPRNALSVRWSVGPFVTFFTPI